MSATPLITFKAGMCEMDVSALLWLQKGCNTDEDRRQVSLTKSRLSQLLVISIFTLKKVRNFKIFKLEEANYSKSLFTSAGANEASPCRMRITWIWLCSQRTATSNHMNTRLARKLPRRQTDVSSASNSPHPRQDISSGSSPSPSHQTETPAGSAPAT